MRYHIQIKPIPIVRALISIPMVHVNALPVHVSVNPSGGAGSPGKWERRRKTVRLLVSKENIKQSIGILPL